MHERSRRGVWVPRTWVTNVTDLDGAPMAITEIRLAAASFVLTSLLIVAIHLLTS